MTYDTATNLVTAALITSAVILWLLVLWPWFMKRRSDQGHGRHTGPGVLPQGSEHRALHHEVENDEAHDGADDQAEPSPDIHGRIISGNR